MSSWKQRLKGWFFQRYKFTKQSIFWTLLCVIIFALTLYFMNVMANVASYLSPDNTTTPKLSDRLFEAIPSIKLLWLTDLADALMFVPTIILVLTHYRPLYLLCKVLLTWALCNLMRITTVAITSFPDPRDGCMHSLGEFFTTFTLHRCGDCMFSGHTVIFVISALVWTGHGYHRFPRRLRWLAWISLIFVWCLCIGSAIIVIANRAHYTVDVLVAFYVAGGNFYIWTYIFHRYIESKGRLRDMTHPWGDGPDPRPHVQERDRRKREAQGVTDPEKYTMTTNSARVRETPMQSVVIDTPVEPEEGPSSIRAHPHDMVDSGTRSRAYDPFSPQGSSNTGYQHDSPKDGSQLTLPHGQLVIRTQNEHPTSNPAQLPGTQFTTAVDNAK